MGLRRIRLRRWVLRWLLGLTGILVIIGAAVAWMVQGASAVTPIAAMTALATLLTLLQTLGTAQSGRQREMPIPSAPRRELPTPPERAGPGDAGEPASVPVFFGRDDEVRTLRRWLIADRCRLVALLGRGGMGKTTLAAHVVAGLRDEFDVVFWRSLLNAQPLEETVRALVAHVGLGEPPATLREQLRTVEELLRRRRCLIVLDNAESLFARGRQAGSYAADLAGYGALLELVATVPHRSCLLMTSREKPAELVRHESRSGPVRVLSLDGLSDAAGRELMADRGLTSPGPAWSRLISRYSGNPLELKLVCDTVLGVFQGDVTAFLRERTDVVGDTHELLAGQFDRMARIEQAVMYWFAIRREPVTIGELERDVAPPTSRRELIAALESLIRRSMATGPRPGSFTAHPVILEFALDRLLSALFRELTAGTPDLLGTHALTLATAKQYIRDAQGRLLVEPLVRRLEGTFARPQIRRLLANVLEGVRAGGTAAVGYTTANVLQLALHLGFAPAGFAFSGLTVREADLRGVTLRDVDFSEVRFERTVFTETFGVVECVAVSGDGTLVAAGTVSGDVRVWSLADARPVAMWNEHSGAVWSVAFGHQDGILVSGGADRTIRIWDLRTNRCVQVCHGHEEGVAGVACHPTEPVVASAGHDNVVRVWNALTGRQVHVLSGHGNWVDGLAFSSNGHRLATCSLDGTVRVWRLEDGECLMTLSAVSGANPADGFRSVAISPDDRWLAASGHDGLVQLWALEDGRSPRTLRAHSDRARSLAFDPVTGLLATGGEDRLIRIWDPVTGRRAATLSGHDRGVSGVAWAAGERRLVSSGLDQTVRIWDVDRAECLLAIRGHEQPVRAVACAPDASLIATAGYDTDIRLWTARPPYRARSLRGHQHWVQALAFSPDGRLLASTGDDRTVRIWDVTTGQCLHVLHGHTGWVADVAFSPDGARLASGGTHQRILIWDTATGRSLTSIDAYDSAAGALAFTPDGRLLVTGGHDHLDQVRLWDAQTGEHVATLAGHVGAVTSLAVSADSGLAITGGVDGQVIVWDLRAPRHRHRLAGGGHRVTTVAVDPGGSLAASGGEDRTIQLWDLSTGACVRVLRGHPAAVTSVAFLDTGTVVSASSDGTVRLWDTATGLASGTLVPDRPYERMNLTGALGLSPAQRETLRRLGAVDEAAAR
ncbi:NACHT domain-containing protein [Actinomadura sp. KC216]|nr:NACHT domain-containing protein [Actinomadura sp. KC216]